MMRGDFYSQETAAVCPANKAGIGRKTQLLLGKRKGYLGNSPMKYKIFLSVKKVILQ
jgi:hypothetical protein